MSVKVSGSIRFILIFVGKSPDIYGIRGFLLNFPPALQGGLGLGSEKWWFHGAIWHHVMILMGFWSFFSWICWYFFDFELAFGSFLMGFWVFFWDGFTYVHLRSKFHCCGRKVGDGCDLWVPCWVPVSKDASSSTPVDKMTSFTQRKPWETSTIMVFFLINYQLSTINYHQLSSTSQRCFFHQLSSTPKHLKKPTTKSRNLWEIHQKHAS